GCTPTTLYYENHDHGIDLGSGVASANGVTVRNNVVYNCTRGWPIQIFGSALARVRILNNTFSTASPYRDGHITIYDMTMSDSLVANNIFYDPQTSAVSMGGALSFTAVTIERNLTLASSMTNAGPPAGM